MNNRNSPLHQESRNVHEQTRFLGGGTDKIVGRTEAEDQKVEHSGIEPIEFEGIFMNRNRLIVERLSNLNNDVLDPIFEQELLNNEKTGSKSQTGKKISYVRRPLSQMKDLDDKGSIPKKKTLLNQSL